MADPRYTELELWQRVCSLCENRVPFRSVVKGHEYTVASIDETAKTYFVQYESGRAKPVDFRGLYAVYAELYKSGTLRRNELREPANGQRIVGHEKFSHAPGATIYAILPALDDRIQVGEGGHLSLAAQ